MMKSSPQVLAHNELVGYAKAIAIMALRFEPFDSERFYHAHEIAVHLGELPQGQLSTFHVEIDTLKKALSNTNIRNSLMTALSY